MRTHCVQSALLLGSLTLFACTGGGSPDARDATIDATDTPSIPVDALADVPIDAMACMGPNVEDLA